MLAFTLVLAGLLYLEHRSDRKVLLAEQRNELNLQKRVIASDFRAVITDLLVLSELHEVKRYFLDIKGESESELHDLNKVFLSFANQKRFYDQLRLLDLKGDEVARINYRDGSPQAVSAGGLQYKGDRYYFKETIKLGEGNVYLSPFDLNVERGEIERPLKPIIRFGVPAFGFGGYKKGVVIVNYRGQHLLDAISMVNKYEDGKTLLLNSDGYYMKGLRPEDEWGFMFKEAQGNTFKDAFPEAWGRMNEAGSGQFITGKGLFTYIDIYPLQEVEGLFTELGESFDIVAMSGKGARHWKSVVFVPSKSLNAITYSLLGRFLILYLLLMFVIALASLFVARMGIKSKRVEDEIRKLSMAVEQSSISVVITDTDGIIEYVNPKFSQVTSYSKQEALGQSPFILKSGKMAKETYRDLWDTIKSGRGWSGDLINLKKNGELFI